MSVIRSIDFDFLVAVTLNDNYSVQEIWQFPVAPVQKYGYWVERQNGWVTFRQPPMTADEAAEQLR